MTPEKTLQNAVEDIAARLDLRWHHCQDSRLCSGPAGFPDLVLVGPSGVLWVELKSSTGQLKPEQRTWRYAIEDAGAEYRLWRPDDLFTGEIRSELERIAGRQLPAPHIASRARA